MEACLWARRLEKLIPPASSGALLVCASTVACAQPSRLPDVLPLTPTADVFLLAGTVTETAPTTSIRIPHALLTLDGVNSGASTTTDGDGRFSFGDVRSGRFNLVASRDGYEARTFPIELKRDSDFAIRIHPSLEIVTETYTSTLDRNAAPCRPGESSCYSHTYGIVAHHTGELSMQLDWTGDADLELSGPSDPAEMMSRKASRSTSISGGRSYSVQVVYAGGTGPAKYTLVITHPN